ncbi:MAG: hypothetical protein HKN03_00920 [Acidimicrobiales bacterium]|nr:hypothetical protein [Acidimicrobiales bacterium]
MLARPLQEALMALKAEFQGESVLMATLPADAVFARATGGELDECIPRLLELVAVGDLADRYAFEVFDLLATAGWQEWDMPAVQAISHWADAWWRTILVDFPGEQRAADRLGELAHLNLTAIRWLGPWLEYLDGPAAQHLADFVINGSLHPAWVGFEDQYQQAVAWTQSETLINGITMVAGAYFEPGQMAEVLERVVVTPGLA